MRKLIIVFSILLMSLCSFSVVHKFYVSVTEIEFNAAENSLQIISRIFIDDIEEVIKERYDTSIELASNKEDNDVVDTYIQRYLSQRFTINVDGQEVYFKFIGKEYEDDLMLCYLEVENVTSLNVIKVSNTILMELFEDQQNIIHVKHGGKRKSLILEKEKDKGMLKFNK